MTRDEQWLLREKYGGKKTPEFEADVERLRRSEPLGYVIGWQPFLGLKIYLDSPCSAKATQGTRSFIPRPETEWWTDQLLKDARKCRFEDVSQRDGARHSKFSAENYACPRAGISARLSFLDLCAGSGAIGCAALAHIRTRRHDDASNVRVYFGEIEPAHKTTILKNIRENNLDESRADIRIGDLFSAGGGPASGGELFGDIKFDIIAVNPPYIPSGRVLPPSVADYEPANALYAGTDGLSFIRRIAAELSKHLAKNGVLWLECDSPTAETARALFEEQGFNAEIRNDQYGVPRVVVVSFH